LTNGEITHPYTYGTNIYTEWSKKNLGVDLKKKVTSD
jgi:hypothetical protein